MTAQAALKIKEKITSKCEYCGSPDNTLLGYRNHEPGYSISKKDTFGIYKCNDCKLLFNFPKPTAEELKRFFQSEYHVVKYNRPSCMLGNILRSYPKKCTWTIMVMRTKQVIGNILQNIRLSSSVDIERILRQNLSRRTDRAFRVVEIGPGIAPQLHLGYMGYDYTAVEPDKQIVSAFNKKGYRNIIEGFAEDLSFIGDNSVDAVVLIGTLSHVYDLKTALSECRRILKENGMILIIDSNADKDMPKYISGSYTNYGFSRQFLENAVGGFMLSQYFYIDSCKRIDENGGKILAVLKKGGKS